MKKYAVINSENKVVNIIIWDGLSIYNPGQGLQLIEILDGTLVDFGYTYDGVNFNP